LHLRRFALVTRALRFLARSPCLAAPSMQFLFIGSRFTLHASFPRLVTLTQLRFTSLVVTNSRRDLHPQEYAHAGRTRIKGSRTAALSSGSPAASYRCFMRLPDGCLYSDARSPSRLLDGVQVQFHPAVHGA